MQSYPSLKRKEQGTNVKPGQSSEKTGHEPTASKVQMDFIDSKDRGEWWTDIHHDMKLMRAQILPTSSRGKPSFPASFRPTYPQLRREFEWWLSETE